MANHADTTQDVLEVLEQQGDVFVNTTQDVVEVLEQQANVPINTTQDVLEALERPDATQTEARFSQYVIEVLIPLACPIFPPQLCPGDVDGTRTDGLPYTNTAPPACSGSGTKSGARTGQ